MLHAGIGLGFAQGPRSKLPHRPSDEELGAATARIVELCQNNSRPGYTGTALESIGLVVHTFFSHLTARASRQPVLGAQNGFALSDDVCYASFDLSLEPIQLQSVTTVPDILRVITISIGPLSRIG